MSTIAELRAQIAAEAGDSYASARETWEALQKIGESQDVAQRAYVRTKYVMSFTGMLLGVYHGYERNNRSVVWGLAWGALGFYVPLLAVGAALVQGIGKPRQPLALPPPASKTPVAGLGSR
jgi:hypothetical protein